MRITLDLVLGAVGSVCSYFLQTTLLCDLGIHFFPLLCLLVFSYVKWSTSLQTTWLMDLKDGIFISLKCMPNIVCEFLPPAPGRGSMLFMRSWKSSVTP